MQVVTSENFQQLVQTGRVDEFKPPEAPKDAKPSDASPTRDEQGRFVSAKNDSIETKPDTVKDDPAAAKAADDSDEGDDDLPERARKQIGKKHRAMKEAEEFARDSWRKQRTAEERADKAERELGEIRSKSRPAQDQEEKPPKPEDFNTVAEYTAAAVKYQVAEELKQRETKAETERAEQAKQRREHEFAQRIAQAAEKYPDFQQVVESIAGGDDEQVPIDVIEYVQESEFGVDLLYTLAKDPKIRDQLRKLSPRKAVAYLGRLEAKFEKAADAPAAKPDAKVALSDAVPAQVSKAPAPIQPIEHGTAKVESDPAKMSFKELREFERKREAERRASR